MAAMTLRFAKLLRAAMADSALLAGEVMIAYKLGMDLACGGPLGVGCLMFAAKISHMRRKRYDSDYNALTFLTENRGSQFHSSVLLGTGSGNASSPDPSSFLWTRRRIGDGD